jgi:hypothetical protein
MLGVLPDARRISEMYVNPDKRTPTERETERALVFECFLSEFSTFGSVDF